MADADAAGAAATGPPDLVTQALQHVTLAMHAIQGAVNGLPAAMQAALQPPAPPAGPFLYSPLEAGVQNIIDLSTKDGKKYYCEATCSLLPVETSGRTDVADVADGRSQPPDTDSMEDTEDAARSYAEDTARSYVEVVRGATRRSSAPLCSLFHLGRTLSPLTC